MVKYQLLINISHIELQPLGYEAAKPRMVHCRCHGCGNTVASQWILI